MITLDIGQIVLAFLAALGIPSAIMGIIVRRIERRFEKRDREAENKARAQAELLYLLVKSTRASIALGEATAKAVQRIPDAHCNGDMQAALSYATGVKHEQKDFLAHHGVESLLED